MPGILDRMACGVALALAIGGVSCAADPPPRQKWPLGGVGLEQGAGAQKSRTPGGNLFFSDFLIIFDVAFVCEKI